MEEGEQKTADMAEEEPLNKKQKNKKDKLKIDSRWRNMITNITVEPLLAGLIIPSVISRFAMSNLNLDKACRVNLQFDDMICDALIKKSSKNFTEYEKKVQELISSIEIWKSVIQTALPCLLIMFLGAWSDRTGKRKVIILLPIFGELLTCINNIVNVYFFYEIPVQVTVLLETLFFSITGGWVTMFLGVFSYISDITKEESRTFRVGVVNFCMTAGFPIGFALSGYLLKNMGYYALFSTIGIMFTLVLLYGHFCLLEPDNWLKEKGQRPIVRPEDAGISFFDLSHVVDTLAVTIRHRPSNKRVKLILTLIATFIMYGPASSEHNVFYLFVRNKLNWDMVKYGLYASYSIILHTVGAMFSIIILSKRLQMEDSMLCFISVLSKFAGSIWTAFVTTDIELFCIPLIELLGACIFTSLRSIITKLVEKQETAKVNSLFALTETLASLLFQPLYSWVYMKTLSVLPGTVFLISAALTVPAMFILLSFYIGHKIKVIRTKKNKLEGEDKLEAESKAGLMMKDKETK